MSIVLRIYQLKCYHFCNYVLSNSEITGARSKTPWHFYKTGASLTKNGALLTDNRSRSQPVMLVLIRVLIVCDKMRSPNKFCFLDIVCMYYFVYSSGYCRRWRSRMQVKILADSLFNLCKLSYFVSTSHHITSKFCTNKEDTCFMSYRNSG